MTRSRRTSTGKPRTRSARRQFRARAALSGRRRRSERINHLRFSGLLILLNRKRFSISIPEHDPFARRHPSTAPRRFVLVNVAGAVHLDAQKAELLDQFEFLLDRRLAGDHRELDGLLEFGLLRRVSARRLRRQRDAGKRRGLDERAAIHGALVTGPLFCPESRRGPLAPGPTRRPSAPD